MQTHSDSDKRVVSLSVLTELCKQASSTCHRYTIVKVSRSRVHVEYSNPDEYGNPNPMTAVFPCYPGAQDNPNVVLDFLTIFNDRYGEGYQSFFPLTDAASISPPHWKSAYQFFRAKAEGKASGGWDEVEWLEGRFFSAIMHTCERAGYWYGGPEKSTTTAKGFARALAEAFKVNGNSGLGVRESGTDALTT